LYSYNNYYSLFKKIIRKENIIFFEDKFRQSQNDPKSTWRTINGILNRNKNNKTHISDFQINNETITDKQRIANEFNSYYTSIGANLAVQIPQTNIKWENFMTQIEGNKFSFTDVSEHQVKSIVNSLKNKNSDVYTVPNWVYKYCINEIAHVLSTLYNDSLKLGQFPSGLKTARVVPIPKTNNSSHPKDFRPISILHTIGKILEKLVHMQYTDYLHDNELMSPTQFGFTKNCNTEHALIHITEHIYKALDENHTCVLLLLDFKKAFDVVPHDILLYKLEMLGATHNTLKWFKSYLTDRSQYVRLENVTSPPAFISHGVPQGSVLGPLLFNIFTNDFHKCHHSIHSQYADDTAILISDCSIQELNNKVNKELQSITTWVEANKLSLNLQKTQYLVISNSKSNIQLNVKVRDVVINRVPSAKLLGIILDDKLSFKNHINSIVSKLSSISYALLKIKHFVPKSILKKIYHGLVYPHLLYGIGDWGSTSEYLLQPLKTIHKKIVRHLSGSRDYYEHTTPLFKHLSLLKHPDIFMFAVTTQIFKINNGMSPRTLIDIIDCNQTVTRANMRSSNTLNLAKAKFRLTKSRRSISYRGVALWNSLPAVLKQSLSLACFRKNIKAYLLARY